MIPESSDRIVCDNVSFSHGDIHAVVDDFYTRVQADLLLKVPFQSVHDWPEHIRRLTHFWWLRLGGKPYLFAQYNPVVKHFFAGFNSVLLERWLALFHQTLRVHLNPEQIELWTFITQQMGKGLSARNEAYTEAYKSR